MKCSIYKGSKREDTYIFLESPVEFEKVPGHLRSLFGDFIFVMELEIINSTRLARESAVIVLKNINEQGFHIQLPPKTEIAEINKKNR